MPHLKYSLRNGLCIWTSLVAPVQNLSERNLYRLTASEKTLTAHCLNSAWKGMEHKATWSLTQSHPMRASSLATL